MEYYGSSFSLSSSFMSVSSVSSDFFDEINFSPISEHYETDIIITQETSSKFARVYHSSDGEEVRLQYLTLTTDDYDVMDEIGRFISAIIERIKNKKSTYACEFFIDDKVYGFNDRETDIQYTTDRIDDEFFTNDYYSVIDGMITSRDEKARDKSIDVLEW